MQPTINNQEALQQGLNWLKAEHKEIIRLSVRTLGLSNIEYYRTMTSEQRRVIATNNLDGMISRLEGISINTGLMKASFVALLRQGASLQVMLVGVDELMKVITNRADSGLAKQPIIQEALLQKASYYINLVKATMASAMIEYEAGRTMVLKPMR